MTDKDIINAFKKKAKEIALKRNDIRFKKTMAFMRAKGLLDTNLQITPMTSLRLNINDVIWAGKNVEPRIIEVLPAAVLHFPKNFTGMDHIPKELRDVIECIRRDDENGPDFAGLEYKKMKFWANSNLKDKRTRPVAQRRRSKLFRLRPAILDKLEKLVKSGQFSDQTSAIEAAIEKLA